MRNRKIEYRVVENTPTTSKSNDFNRKKLDFSKGESDNSSASEVDENSEVEESKSSEESESSEMGDKIGTTHIQLPVFDGTNYSTWKYRLKIIPLRDPITTLPEHPRITLSVWWQHVIITL